MSLGSIFGSVAIGKDTSGNFKLSPYGLAVRSGPDSRFIARRDDELVDVTDITFAGTENLIYRIPKMTPSEKDIIIRSDNPFSVLFVDKVDNDDGRVEGTDPDGNIQQVRPVTNLLTQALAERSSFFVTVASLDSFLEGGRESSLLSLLLLAGQAGGSNSAADPWRTMLFLQGLGGRELDEKTLALLMLLQGTAAAGTNDPLTIVLALRFVSEGYRRRGARQEPPRGPNERRRKKDRARGGL